MSSADPLLVVSPHFDDAVLSLRRALAARPGSLVATALSRPPNDHTLVTNWDEPTGIRTSYECMQIRTEEDREALRILGAQQHLLGFFDGQYGRVDPAELTAAIVAMFEQQAPGIPCGPVGLVHADHVMVADAFVAAATQHECPAIWLYEEVPYRVEDRRMVKRRLRGLERLGWHLERDYLGTGSATVAEAALGAYESQVPLLAGRNLHAQETVWRAVRR